MSETRGLHRATKVLQPPQRFPTAGGELRNSWLALKKNDAFYEGKTWAKGLTVFSKVGNSGGPTSPSPNISVHQTEKGKATYLPGRDEHERVGTVTALQTHKSRALRGAALNRALHTSLLSASRLSRALLQVCARHFWVFLPHSFLKKIYFFTYQSCTVFSSRLGRLLTVKPNILLHTLAVSLLCSWAAGMPLFDAQQQSVGSSCREWQSRMGCKCFNPSVRMISFHKMLKICSSIFWCMIQIGRNYPIPTHAKD